MRCPFCSHLESKVTDSRNAVEQNAIRRRRECLECQKRFTTFETIDLTIQVHKRDGRYEDFLQEKLIKGLDAACRHTRISHDQVRALAYRITTDLMERQVREIETTELGEIVMKHLQEMDTIAFIRFACVYRRFKDVDELMDEIQNISPVEGITRSEEVGNDFKKEESYAAEKK
jgi:transcriptional repressor NrdR